LDGRAFLLAFKRAADQYRFAATEFCWKCNLEWHEGITCEQAQRIAQKGKKKLSRAEKKVKCFQLLCGLDQIAKALVPFSGRAVSQETRSTMPQL